MVVETPPTRESLLAELCSLAARLDADMVSRTTWLRETGISERHIRKHFDTWNEFVVAAGLRADDRSRVDDDALFEAMRDAFVACGGIAAQNRFQRHCRYSVSTYATRWGRWQRILGLFRGWAQENDPSFPYLDALPRHAAPVGAAEDGAPSKVRSRAVWESNQRAQFGPFLNFRGLQHSPINEQGVVFLFGIVAFELGYVVEGVGTGYPDCEAKRCVSRSGDVWERVRIEFEYRSRSFREHGHDPAGCDLIVCWEHNWPECPVEVLELRTAIEPLSE